MLFYNKDFDIFHELEVNGRQVNTDDDNAPTDYTAGNDAGAETTPAPADDTPESNPEDYTVPDEGEGEESAGTDPAEGDDQPAEGEDNPPEDYTDDEGGGDEGVDDMGGGEEGENDMGGEEGGDTGEDTGGDNYDTTDSGGDNEIQDLEKDVFSDLSDEQMAIKDRELKSNFSNMYDIIIDMEERINDISKDANMIKPLEFVSNKLSELSDQVSDYLSYTYSTRTYTENMINYNTFISIIEQINEILEQIRLPNAK